MAKIMFKPIVASKWVGNFIDFICIGYFSSTFPTSFAIQPATLTPNPKKKGYHHTIDKIATIIIPMPSIRARFLNCSFLIIGTIKGCSGLTFTISHNFWYNRLPIILLVINRLYRCKYGRFWCIFTTKKLHRCGTDRIVCEDWEGKKQIIYPNIPS